MARSLVTVAALSKDPRPISINHREWSIQGFNLE